MPGLNTPNGAALDERVVTCSSLDFGTGDLLPRQARRRHGREGRRRLGGGDGLAWDHYGRLFVIELEERQGLRHPAARRRSRSCRPKGFESAADICLDPPTARSILVPDMKAGTLTAVPDQVPGPRWMRRRCRCKTELAFPDLKWTGLERETDTGKAERRCGRSC